MRKLASVAVAMIFAASTLLVGSGSSSDASASWKTLAKGSVVTTLSGGKNGGPLGPSTADVTTTTHRYPIKVQIVVTWKMATISQFDATFVSIEWERVCRNLGQWPPIREGSKFRPMRDGATFTRTWETSRDLCDVRVAARNLGGSETPPGRLTVEIRELR